MLFFVTFAVDFGCFGLVLLPRGGDGLPLVAHGLGGGRILRLQVLIQKT